MFVAFSNNVLSFRFHIIIHIVSMEEDDQQFEYTYEDEDYGDMDEDFGDTDEDEDEIIDYDGMKNALELIQKVRL